MAHNLRRRLRQALKETKKSKSSLKLLGCSLDDFKKHLESLWLEGMTWENYGEWHIDHKLPCNTFDLSIEDEQRKCFHYTNLRPLWRLDNLSRPKLGQDLKVSDLIFEEPTPLKVSEIIPPKKPSSLISSHLNKFPNRHFRFKV